MQGKMSILLVDDDEAANFLNSRLIERVNDDVQVNSVLNGKEALAYLAGTYPNSSPEGLEKMIIFLDINMPVMDGFEFLEALEISEGIDVSNMSIIVLSSSVNDRDVARAKSHQIYDYLSKPLTKDKVRHILNETMKN